MNFSGSDVSVREFYDKLVSFVGTKFPSDEDRGNMAFMTFSSFFKQTAEGCWEMRPAYKAYNLTPEQAFRTINTGLGKGVHPPIEVFAERVSCSADSDSIPVRFERKEQFRAELENLEEKDYIYISNFLCHADVPNDNGDVFGKDDLIYALTRMDFSPIHPCIVDENHSQVPALGVTLDAYYTFDELANADGLVVYSTLWNWGMYREHVSDLARQLDEGSAKFSMQCLPEHVLCSLCGKPFNDPEDYCIHLKNRAEFPEATRILKFPKFFANSIIAEPRMPADRFARPLSVANKGEQSMCVKCEELTAELVLAQAKITELESEKVTATESIATLSKDQEELQGSLKTLQASLSDVEASLESKAEELKVIQAELDVSRNDSQNMLAAKEVEVTQLNELLSEAKVNVRMAQLAGKIELGDEVEFVKNEARTRDEATWSAFVDLLVKHTVVDPHVDASLGLITPNRPTKEDFLPNIRKCLK